MKKSIFSWIALIIGVCLVLAQPITVGFNVTFESPLVILFAPLFFPYASFIWSMVGIACGVIGLVRKEPRKKLAIVGLILLLIFSFSVFHDWLQSLACHPPNCLQAL